MRMKRIVIATIVLVSGLLILAGCSSQLVQRIRATWVDAQIIGDAVSLPLDEVQKDVIVHSKVSTPTDDFTFMVYEYNDKVYVRADICPPCRSDSFSLVGDTLVCDACATVFNAKTGAGIKGACVRYPKASVPYTIEGSSIVMTGRDVSAAFRETLVPKK